MSNSIEIPLVGRAPGHDHLFPLYQFHFLIEPALDNLRSASELPLDSVNNGGVTSAWLTVTSCQVVTSSTALTTTVRSWIIELYCLRDLCLLYWRVMAIWISEIFIPITVVTVAQIFKCANFKQNHLNWIRLIYFSTTITHIRAMDYR